MTFTALKSVLTVIYKNILLDKMPMHSNKMFNIMVTLGMPDQGKLKSVHTSIGLLQAPGRSCRNWSRGNVF